MAMFSLKCVQGHRMGALSVSKVGVCPDAWDHSAELKEKPYSICFPVATLTSTGCCGIGRKLNFQEHGDLLRKNHRQRGAGLESR